MQCILELINCRNILFITKINKYFKYVLSELENIIM